MSLIPVTEQVVKRGGRDDSESSQKSQAIRTETGQETGSQSSNRSSETKAQEARAALGQSNQVHLEEGTERQTTVTKAHTETQRTSGGGSTQTSAVHQGFQFSMEIAFLPNTGSPAT